MDKMIIDYPLEVQRGVFTQSGAVFLAIYFLPKKTMKAVRTPAFVVLRAINLNVENVLSLVLSLDCVSPSVWVTNGFLKKNS